MAKAKEEVIRPDLSPEKAIELFRKQLSKVEILNNLPHDDPEWGAFRNFNINLITRAFGNPSVNLSSYYSKEFGGPRHANMDDYEIEEGRKKGLQDISKLFESFIEQLESFTDTKPEEVLSDNPIKKIINICDRFHLIIKELKQRHDNRDTIEINDEYDVQDIFRSLLKLFFDDIRTEEWTPSYAGSHTRMDFLLKKESLVIEIKKTRTGLKAKEIGQQLIIDIAHYKEHRDCKTLICFVYDPEELITNQGSLETDLSKKETGVEVVVIVAPKGY